MIGKPYSGKLNVRFDEGELETVNRYRSQSVRAPKGPEAASAKRQLSTLPYDYCETVDGDHGRIETRRYWTTSAIEWVPDKHLWKHLNTVVMVQRERIVSEKVGMETSYYISSLESKAAELAKAVRGHWSIENSLHWVLDIAFREDESRVRKDHAPENLAVLRHMALNLLKKEGSSKRGIKTKRLRAGWDNDYLCKIINS